MFDLKIPCVNCPFRIGMGERFQLARLDEILTAIAFQCHKTVAYGETDEGETHNASEHPQQCAGLMAVLHRSGQPNMIMQVAERLGYFDPSELDPRQEAYASIEEARKAHEQVSRLAAQAAHR